MNEINFEDTHVTMQVPADGPIKPSQLYQRSGPYDPIPNPYLQYDRYGLWIVIDLDDGTSVRKLVSLDRARQMVDFIEQFVLPPRTEEG